MNDMKLDPAKTWLPVTVLVGLVGTIAVGAWTASQWKASLDRNFEAIVELRLAVHELRQTISEVPVEDWGAGEHELWVRTFAELNPTLKLPPTVARTKPLRR